VQNILASLLKGQQFDPMVQRTAPGLTPVPQAGKLDSLWHPRHRGSIGSAAYGARRQPVPPSSGIWETSGGG
jgi:hypothetical protein